MSGISGFAGGGYDLAAVPLIGLSAAANEMKSDISRGLANTAAITADGGVWQTILDVAGSGFLRGAAVYGGSISSGHSLSLKITIDGVAYELTKTASGSNIPVLVTTGALFGTGSTETTPMYIPQSTLMHRFKASLKIEAKRSLTGNTATAGYTHSLDRS